MSCRLDQIRDRVYELPSVRMAYGKNDVAYLLALVDILVGKLMMIARPRIDMSQATAIEFQDMACEGLMFLDDFKGERKP